MKAKILLICMLALLALNLVSCTEYRFNDYRGYYQDYKKPAFKDHHIKSKPHHDRD